MAVSRVKVWSAGEVLTASDLNSEFNNIISNGQDLGSPRTKAFDMDGQQIVLDADADSYLVEDSDDVIKLRLQGVDLFYWDGDATSPVNGLTFTASATSVAPDISATGTDSNIGVTVKPKGTGDVTLTLNSVAGLMTFEGNVSTPVNGLTFTPAATGAAPSIASHGTDTNIDCGITPKGTGAVKLGGTGNVFYLNNVKVRPVRVGAIYFSFNYDSDYEVKLDGRTIGSAASGANNASDDYEDVYTVLWDNLADSEAAVSSGRGASAAADFAADKTLTLPDFSGRVPGALDNMSGTSRNVITNTAADTAGKTMGAETATIAQANLPNVNFTVDIPSGQGSHTHTTNAVQLNGTGGQGTSGLTFSASTINNATLPAMSGTAASGGSGTAVDKTQPTIFGYWVIAF